jgi:NAD(P)-dependent dehydrogenase (short-subunit alcohol dehydrogenase family)
LHVPMLSAAADRIAHGAIIMSDPTSTHKVAAVTGGVVGISHGIVIALTQRDFDVVVCDRTIDPAIAKSMTASVAPAARISFVKNDLADSADLPRFVDEMFSSMKCPLPSVTSTAARVSTRQT